MANVLFTVIYILAGFWVFSKLVAWLIQRALKQHLGVSLKIGKLGLMGFSKLQLTIGIGLTIEIDRIWLSSSFLNPDIRKPLVLCVQDIRIQTTGHVQQHAETDQIGPRGENSMGSTGGGTDRLQNILVKGLFIGQFFGVRIQNLTVVLLKSMIPDSLVHVTAGEILLDITIYNENYVMKTNLSSVLFKALRSAPGEADAQNCLAELSVTLQMEARSDTTKPLQLTTLKWQVLKPQMMLTEGFLQNLPKSRSSAAEVESSVQDIDDDELFRTVDGPGISGKLAILGQLRAFSFEILDLDVKIVRETKQRSLAVSLKQFQVCLTSSLTAHHLLDFSFTLLLEEFLTKSPQAQFAELSKIRIKTERFCSFNSIVEDNVACLQNLMQSFGLSSIRDTVEMTVKIYNGFFHYHHEEVQYWSAVFWRVSKRDNPPAVVRQRSPEKLFIKSSPWLAWLHERKTNVILDMTQLSSAISSAACTGLHLQLSQARISASLKAALGVENPSTLATAFDISLEIEVQTVWCCHLEAKIPEEEVISPVHHWDHVLYLALLILKVQKLGHEVRMEALENNLSLEWSTKTYEVLSQLITAVSRPRSSASQFNESIPLVLNSTLDRTLLLESSGVQSGANDQVMVAREQNLVEEERGKPLPSNIASPMWHVSLMLDVSDINLFICDSAGVCTLLHVKSIAVQHMPYQSSLSLDVFRILYLKYSGKSLSMHRVNEASSVLHIHEVKASYTEGKRELRIHILQELTFKWTMSAHMCVLQGVQNMVAVVDKAHPSQKDKLGISAPKKMSATEHQRHFTINVLVHADIHLSAQLSRNHRLSLHTHSLLVTATLPDIVMEVRNFTVKCDGNNILSVQAFQLETLSFGHLQHEREGFENLSQSVNRGWGLSCESFDIIFPYKYNFAACYEEIMNTVKWLKLVHKIKKKPFTVDSPLPPDIKIKAKMLSIEVCDDPFEVKIGLNYELLKDEVMESKKRTEVMDTKLEQLLRTKNIPVSKREELYASLYKKSSEIYIQRSRQLYSNGPIRKQLLTWLMEDLEIVALADISYHGRENVIKVMKEIDRDSPGPTDDMDFVTLWCRSIKFSVKHWSVSLRDFPQPMIDITNMHMWGRLVGAEREGTRRAKRTCTLELDSPWGNMQVERNLPALKFFHDFSSDVTSLTLAYGVCWEPAVALFNLSMDLISRPSVDPSKPLPFWDKMRLLLHGRLTMAVERNSWLYHASLDPYNNTELMDWTWSHLVLDWTNGQFVLKGDLDISLRTASKYNESKLLHLPNLRFCVGLEWLCLGDANDHHSVMPCAPDKVPDFSLEEHDSFRAFRSQHLNLDLSLKTKPVPANASDVPSAPEFYASSLRFLEKIKQCMFSVTRPVRRGNLFGITSVRKPQLTRHYRKIRISVDFHRFIICHWMSNAKKHGAELVADSFALRMCNRLTLVPIEDGLLHRPRADWSIKYLNCCLGTTQIFLCQESRPNESSSSSGVPVDRSFFLSVLKISYQRADSRKAKPGIEIDPEQAHKTPRHSIAIHEMRGAWNEANRAVVLGLYDSYMKAQALRRNLSSEVLKGFKVDNAQSNAMKNRSFSLNSPENESSSDPTSPSPLSKLQTGHAHSMLLKLMSESDSKSVAFTDETSNTNMELLHGVKACRPINILSTSWLIELHNSQVIVKGCETPGFLIISAARAKVISYIHMPIWRSSQLRSKSTWTGTVDCMQYYATVDPDYVLNDDTIPWLSRENVEDRSTTSLTGLPEMVSSGQSVGSVVSSTVPAAMSTSAEQNPSGEQTVQLQRIIHRCSCKFYYANYGDVDPNSFLDLPLPPTEDWDVMTEEEGVDTFTLLHESLHAYSNSVQYSVIMDIVNNLLLYVEPKKKEASEKLQSMRFKLQLSREDQKTPILQLQEIVRERVQDLRKLERDFYVAKMNSEEERMEDLEVQMEDVKNWINTKNEELSMRISCFNESQLQMKAQMKVEKAQQAQVARRNEVCFKYAKWRLTERDGHCGIAETELRNFVYTKANRDDNTWTHQLELGWLKMENLLRDSFYQKVLMPRDPLDQDGENRQMLLRIFCSERPPVGGISVKEHFEVNVAPIQIQMTYQLYKAVMQYFFPDKNIEVDDDEEMEGGKKKGEKKSSKKEKEKETQPSLKKTHSFSSADDINKMRERAAKNNTFLYLKIPEVYARVSYKGEKEKNIEDVHDFNFVFPTIEYHNCIWTWFDFFIVLKNVAKRVVLSQAIKQKLHMRPRLTDETPVTDVQEEQDKAKMLLGAKLLYGQDKPSKKGFFTKSHKS
ncbi:protein KIAA0100-like isoform X2 [Pomacea canaliculata]|uniref:protein KIAA0100-like isoform X2 n=1 Tax=Pomacea canaliculata TaxID=400727 RepID=UPI000D736ED2|nr:protein KIAA0100-like isoform X2 [Pomacea canaliculata]